MNTNNSTGTRTEIRNLLFLAGLTIIFFWKTIFTDEYSLLTSHDNSRQWYAWYQFASYWLKHGVLPVWDPYTLSGHLFIGEAQPGLFYPLNLLLFTFAKTSTGLSTYSIEWAIVFSSFLLASFQYFLARSLGLSPYASLLSSICYAFGGFTGTIFFGYVGMFNSAIWIPAVLFFFIKARQTQKPTLRFFFAMTAGVLLGFSILAGSYVPPIYIFLVLAFLGVMWIAVIPDKSESRHKRILNIGLIVILIGFAALGTAAVQIFPSTEYVQRAVRWVGADQPQEFLTKIPYAIEGTQGVFPLYQLLGFLIPTMAHYNYLYVYMGILPLILALIAILFDARSRIFLYLLIFSLLYIIGNNTIVHGVGYAVFPLLHVARVAVRALFITHLALALLAGFGADFIIQQIHRSYNRDRLRWVLNGLVTTAVAVSLLALLVGIHSYLDGAIVAKAERMNRLFQFVLMLTLAIGSVYALCRRRGRGTVIQILVTCGLIIDVFSPVSAAVPLKSDFDGQSNYEPNQYYRKTKIVSQILEDRQELVRVDTGTDRVPPYGDVFRMFTTTGVSPSMLKEYYQFRNSDWFGSNVLDLLNVKYVISDKAVAGCEKLLDEGGLSLYVNKDYLPRAFVVPKAKLVNTAADTLRIINSAEFRPREYVLISSIDAEDLSGELIMNNESESSRGTDSRAGVNVVGHTPTRLVMDVDSPSAGLLFVSENYYPGWMAWVDGKPRRVRRANHTFRAVEVDSGKHRIELRYESQSLRAGVIVSLMTLGLWVFAATWASLRIFQRVKT